MKRLKFSLLALLLAAMLPVFVGCGGNSESSEADGRGDVVSEEPAVNAEDFYGCWEAYGEYIWLYIYGDGTYEWFGDYDGSDWIGTYYMLGNALVLDTSVVFVFNEYGDIVDQDGNEMYASELPDEYL